MDEVKRLELEKQQVEERLRMVTRARAVMAECNRILVRASDEMQLLQDMCRIVVKSGGYRTAWIGMKEHDENRTIRPVASIGKDSAHLASTRISWGENEFGQGPAGLAIRSGQPRAVRHIQTDPYFSTRVREIIDRGCRAVVALPLIADSEVLGILSILSDEAEAFDAGELALLDELAHDIAYGLSNLRLRATQRRAEQLLRLEHTVTRCLAQADSAAQALQAVMRAVCQTQDWECGRYFRADDAAGVLRFEEAWGVASPGIEKFIERSRSVTYTAGAGLIGRVWESGEPLWIADLTRDSRAQRLAYTVESGIRAAFLFPVTSEGRTIGVLSFSSREIREPDGRLLQAVHVIGSQIGQFVQRLRGASERARAEQLQNLEHAVAHTLAESEDTAAALTALMRLICETEGWECGRYFRVDEAGGVLRFAGAWHVPESIFGEFVERSRESTHHPGAGLIGRVWQSGQPLWSTDLHNDPRSLRLSHSLNLDLRAAFNFPVTAEGRTIGVLSFSTRKVRDPDDGLLRTIQAIGSQIGQFLRRQQTEQVLRESEARFRSLTTLSSDWYWEQDAEYRFVDMTSEIDRMTGVSALAHIGKRRWELAAPNMTEADWTAHRAVVEAHQPFHDLELCRHAGDGTVRWVSISGEPIVDAQGTFTGYRGIGRDITARKREERLLTLEHAVARSLAEADSVSTALKSVLRAICESEGWECGRYLKVDEQAGVLRFHEFWHKPDPSNERFIAEKRDAALAPGSGLAGRVWQSGQPLWTADSTTDERGLGSLVNLETGMRGAFLFPAMAEGKTIGVLTFNSRQVRDPDERLLQAVRVIGGQIGQFVQRKQSEETVRDQALQQRLIAEFGQQALASPDLAQVLHRATELVSGTLRIEYCSVLELVPGNAHLVYRAVIGWPQEWIGQRIVPITPGGRLAHIIERREPLVTESYGAEGFTPSLAEDYGIRSAAQVPIFGTRGSFGVLSAYALRRRRFSDEEVSFLRSVANILAIAIERKNAEDKLAHLAQFDTVTGLPNRYLLRDRLGQSLTQAQRNNWLGGVLFVDLDRFKAVNDTFGHGVGDKLLSQVAARLKDCVRSGDTVARLSGDEFAVVLSNLAKSDDAGLVAQKIVAALAAPFSLDGHQVYISASVGIALYPGDGSEPDTLLKNADTAMYRAKEQGRNCYQFYLPQMNERLMERLSLEARLRGALDRGEFVLHYQPKVQLDTGVISGFEALLRWRQDDRLVPPLEFIPILEDTGLIVPVGEWVLRSVCEQLKQWKDQGIVPRPVAVNLSSRQFQQKSLVIMIDQILRETGMAPELLELELTETLLMSDAQEAVQMLRELKSLGVRLSVDDFGTGYSSLSYLKRFPLDTLKIDRAFIKDAVSNPDDATLTLTIINLAHSMRLKVVAEGVETQEQLNFLRLHGCDEMQGYFFARPLEVQDCTRALVEDRRLSNPEALPSDGLPALLIVDDSDHDLAMLKRALASNDFHILTANSPAAGFEMLARHGAAIVVSDYNMPGMSGVEFLSNVRRLYPNAVRVVATGGGNPPTLSRAINSAGIHKFLSKDWDPARLRAEVREAYRQQRQAGNGGAERGPSTSG